MEVLQANSARRISRRYAFLSLWSAIAVVSAGICIHNSVTNPCLNRHYSQAQLGTAPDIQNQISNFSYYRYDPKTNRLRFAASVGSLRVENATLGIFKTAAAREIKVKDLYLRLDEHSSPGGPSTEKPDATTDETISDNSGIEDFFAQLVNSKADRNINIDLGNACEMTVDNFECGFFDKDDLRLRVRSRQAIVNSKWPQVTLRGHVRITGADGGVLETNQAKWDTKKQSFTIDGIYVLRRNENQIAGNGIRVDRNLNVTNAKNDKP